MRVEGWGAVAQHTHCCGTFLFLPLIQLPLHHFPSVLTTSTSFAGSRVLMQSASPRLSSPSPRPSSRSSVHDRPSAASGRPTSVIWSQLSKPTTGNATQNQGRIRTGIEHMKDRASSPVTVALEDGLLYSKERKVVSGRVHLVLQPHLRHQIGCSPHFVTFF